MNSIGRRIFLAGSMAGGFCSAASRQDRNETVYRLVTNEWDIRVVVDFHDLQLRRTFGFLDQTVGRQYCLSEEGEENTNCMKNFVGSLAIARYHLRSRAEHSIPVTIQERVRIIDADSRLPNRPPFERTMEAERGVISDIQAFGYQTTDADRDADRPVDTSKEPWSLLRQDLFLAGHTEPFLVIHWRHSLNAIRILDLIPGSETRLLNQRV